MAAETLKQRPQMRAAFSDVWINVQRTCIPPYVWPKMRSVLGRTTRRRSPTIWALKAREGDPQKGGRSPRRGVALAHGGQSADVIDLAERR